MNIDQLQIAIRRFKKDLECLKCKKNFTNKDIDIIATSSIDVLLSASCHKCQEQIIATVSFYPSEQDSEHLKIQDHNAITQNEVLDFKNFINNFNGDFKKIFL